MKISPLSIKQQEFNKSVRGYNVEEVKIFLEQLSNEFENLIEENEKLLKQNAELEKKLKEYRKIEKRLQDTLMNAQESTSKTVESVKKQTSLILREAELKAKQIIDKANKKAEFIRESVTRLNEERKLLIAKLKALIHSQEEILNIHLQEKSFKKEIKPSKVDENKEEIDADNILEKLL